MILSEDGEILTNNHVVEVAEDGGEMTVSFNDGTTAAATIVGTDPVTDLAVIQAEGVSGLDPGRDRRLRRPRTSARSVVAIGSPFGLEATVTSGIVSALNRPVSVGEASASSTATDTIYPAIQTDAAINPGNSGGPLVNMAGEVVGINSSIRSSTSALGGEGGSIGLGFAIPITKVLPIVDQLRNGETATHARLGVTVSQRHRRAGRPGHRRRHPGGRGGLRRRRGRARAGRRGHPGRRRGDHRASSRWWRRSAATAPATTSP